MLRNQTLFHLLAAFCPIRPISSGWQYKWYDEDEMVEMEENHPKGEKLLWVRKVN